jgi:hypothetical protein
VVVVERHPQETLEGRTVRPAGEPFAEEPRPSLCIAHLGDEAEGVLIAPQLGIEPGGPRHEGVESAEGAGPQCALGVEVPCREPPEPGRRVRPQPEPHVAPGPVAQVHLAE